METITFGHFSDVSWMGVPFVMSLTTMRACKGEQYGCCLRNLGARPSKNRKGGSGTSAGVEVYTAEC